MKETKYCCDFFRFDHELDHRVGLNIRVIKVEEPLRIGFLSRTFYRFYITTGYKKGSKNVPRRSIKYCPYCGKNLGKVYTNDSIINETDHRFMMPLSDAEKEKKTSTGGLQ